MTVALRKPRLDDDVDLDARAENVRSVIASARLEGVVISSETREVMTDFTSGLIDEDEAVERVLAMYGPGA